ncbi:MAG: 4Fe-4S binding protein [Firmicutes bacterium]|mgnify:FL=1|nr:4Fe-4S binding protein [Bacillota bacterium]
MIINKEKCIGCGDCVPYCVMGAISLSGEFATIDLHECVECGVCIRADVCPVDAIEQQPLEWPRSLRSFFSDPTAKHPDTGLAGRGTAEMKTNDVTGRFKSGEVGVGIELGRPGLGTWFTDVEKVAMAIAPLGLQWEPENPTTPLIVDKSTGKLQDDVLNEKALSAILEFIMPSEKLEELLKALDKVAKEIDTVFSLEIITKVEPDGSMPNIEKAMELGYEPMPNPKVNVGLGRPKFNG